MGWTLNNIPCALCLVVEMDTCNYIVIHGIYLTIWIHYQVLGRNGIGELMTKHQRKRSRDRDPNDPKYKFHVKIGTIWAEIPLKKIYSTYFSLFQNQLQFRLDNLWRLKFPVIPKAKKFKINVAKLVIWWGLLSSSEVELCCYALTWRWVEEPIFFKGRELTT